MKQYSSSPTCFRMLNLHLNLCLSSPDPKNGPRVHHPGVVLKRGKSAEGLELLWDTWLLVLCNRQDCQGKGFLRRDYDYSFGGSTKSWKKWMDRRNQVLEMQSAKDPFRNPNPRLSTNPKKADSPFNSLCTCCICCNSACTFDFAGFSAGFLLPWHLH